MIWSIYNYPRLYDWYMRTRLYWIEDFRRTTFAETVGGCLSDGDTVLDVACGTGVNCMLIGGDHPNVQVTGIDSNPGIVRFAERTAEAAELRNVAFLAGDFTRVAREGSLPVAPDMIICTLGLSVIPDWEKAVEQAHSLLKPGGWFVVLDLFFEKDSVRNRLMHLWVNTFFTAYHDRPILEKLRSAFIEKDAQFDTPIFLFVGRKA